MCDVRIFQLHVKYVTLFIWAQSGLVLAAECDYEIMYLLMCAICSGGVAGFHGSEEAEISRRMRTTAAGQDDTTAAALCMFVFVFWFQFHVRDLKGEIK